jgi:hypothetical protein
MGEKTVYRLLMEKPVEKCPQDQKADGSITPRWISEDTRVYPNVSGLAAWSGNCK